MRGCSSRWFFFIVCEMSRCLYGDQMTLASSSLPSFFSPTSLPRSGSDPILSPSHTELRKAQPLGDRQGQGPSPSRGVSVMTKALCVMGPREKERLMVCGLILSRLPVPCLFVNISISLYIHLPTHSTPMTLLRVRDRERMLPSLTSHCPHQVSSSYSPLPV